VHTPSSPGASLHVCPTFVQAAGGASSAVRRHELSKPIAAMPSAATQSHVPSFLE